MQPFPHELVHHDIDTLKWSPTTSGNIVDQVYLLEIHKHAYTWKYIRDNTPVI